MHGYPDSLVQKRGLLGRFAAWLQACLSARAAPKVIIGLALLLTSGSLTLRFSVDEYVHRVAVREHSNLPGLKRAPWDLYKFAPGAEGDRVLMDEGVLPWWTDSELVVSFFRPLSSLTLWLDQTYWPESGALMRLHSMFWFALLLASVAAVYREFLGSHKLASLALLLYAVDDARAFLVGWVALRNAPIALAPALLALITHHRYRSGQGRAYGLLGPACLALGLLGGEMALAVCAYLFSYAIFLDRGTLFARLRSLLPYAGVVIGYRAWYNALGYGALHSGLYIDPAREPLAFLQALATRLPLLLYSQFALPPSELWEFYPFFSPWLRPAVMTFVLAGLIALWFLFRPLLRESALLQFLALGAVLATIPVCGIFAADRLLTGTSLGGAAILASFFLALMDGTYPDPTRVTRALAGVLVAVHCVFGPALLTVRARDVDFIEVAFERADRSIPRGPEIAQKTLIMLNPPTNAFGVFFSVMREAQGRRLPASLRLLATGESELLATRVDARTLKLKAKDGFLSTSSQRAFHSARRPFHVGDVISYSDLRITVTALAQDGAPDEILARFNKELEDPSFLWLQWDQTKHVPFRPPAIGRSVRLPKVDPLAMMRDDVPGERR